MKFIGILWRENKKIGIILLFFVFMQCFFSYKGIETVPFFNYGMYSAPCSIAKTVEHVRVFSKGQAISLEQVPFRSTAFLHYQVRYQHKLWRQANKDYTQHTIESRFGKNTEISQYLNKYLCSSPSSTKHFYPWFGHYISQEAISFNRQKYEWIDGKLFPVQ